MTEKPSCPISALRFANEEGGFVNPDGSTLKAIRGLSRVNVFVGANNSGKSRLIRKMAASELEGITFADVIKSHVHEAAELLKQAFDIPRKRIGDPTKFEGLDQTQSAFGSEYIPISSDLLANHTHLLEQAEKALSSDAMLKQDPDNKNRAPLTASSQEKAVVLANQALHRLFELDKAYDFSRPKHVYLPVLRSLRVFVGYESNEKRDFYRSQIAEEYGIGDSWKGEIYTGLEAFRDFRTSLLGRIDKRRSFQEFQDRLSREFFDGRTVTIIPNEDGPRKVLLIQLGEERTEREIHNLGDGIQSILTIAFVMSKQEPHFIFIEEPETHLHPGMQRKILNMMARDTRHHYFITTHSNHFLDMAASMETVSIFSVSRDMTITEDRFIVEQRQHGDRECLDMLGVQASSVFLVNATIWVEGHSDRFFLEGLLRTYQESLPETAPKVELDRHYAFFEYQGGNITHFFLDEDHINVERVTSHHFVLADSDGTVSAEEAEAIPESEWVKKQGRRNRLEERLGDQIYFLRVRELENLVHPELLEGWLSKTENPQVKRDFCTKDPLGPQEQIGNYLDRHLNKDRPHPEGKKTPVYCSSSGSLTSARKVELAKYCAKNFRPEHITGELQTIAEKLYDFILEQNHFPPRDAS